MKRIFFVRAAVLGVLLFSTAWANAQSYPSRPVRLVVPFPPGGSADVIARAVAQKMSISLGQQVVIDNKPGAGGNIGAEAVVRSAPDGYTILFATIVLATNPHLYPMSFDPMRDLAAISIVASAQQVLIAHPSVPVTSVDALAALARSKPGTLNFGSAGNGTAGHLATEMLKGALAIDVTHIPYKGAAPAMTDLLGGQLQFMFETMTTAMPQIKAGKVKAIAVTGPSRSNLLPGTPTMIETTPGFSYTAWYGLAVPSATPATIVERLGLAAVAAVAEKDIRDRFLEIGTESVGSTPSEFRKVWEADTLMWGRVIKQARIKLE